MIRKNKQSKGSDESLLNMLNEYVSPRKDRIKKKNKEKSFLDNLLNDSDEKNKSDDSNDNDYYTRKKKGEWDEDIFSGKKSKFVKKWRKNKSPVQNIKNYSSGSDYQPKRGNKNKKTYGYTSSDSNKSNSSKKIKTRNSMYEHSSNNSYMSSKSKSSKNSYKHRHSPRKPDNTREKDRKFNNKHQRNDSKSIIKKTKKNKNRSASVPKFYNSFKVELEKLKNKPTKEDFKTFNIYNKTKYNEKEQKKQKYGYDKMNRNVSRSESNILFYEHIDVDDIDANKKKIKIEKNKKNLKKQNIEKTSTCEGDIDDLKYTLQSNKRNSFNFTQSLNNLAETGNDCDEILSTLFNKWSMEKTKSVTKTKRQVIRKEKHLKEKELQENKEKKELNKICFDAWLKNKSKELKRIKKFKAEQVFEQQFDNSERIKSSKYLQKKRIDVRRIKNQEKLSQEVYESWAKDKEKQEIIKTRKQREKLKKEKIDKMKNLQDKQVKSQSAYKTWSKNKERVLSTIKINTKVQMESTLKTQKVEEWERKYKSEQAYNEWLEDKNSEKNQRKHMKSSEKLFLNTYR
ncbi:hypothetical protein A3Q56_02673 [Intoshia linei]|uniref:Uncharacterized protein n=1 Tax=Intoshia linei TaxID=1819745 RepID=A0A177B5Q6_9BILA|nr:hypothetical protein A3Q56_02673 [Intoshia linei]